MAIIDNTLGKPRWKFWRGYISIDKGLFRTQDLHDLQNTVIGKNVYDFDRNIKQTIEKHMENIETII
uniref:Uncharacterized protein n=1 Tax=Oryza brachyantha TaxID=4533 RepID=J3KYA9_ORYBR